MSMNSHNKVSDWEPKPLDAVHTSQAAQDAVALLDDQEVSLYVTVGHALEPYCLRCILPYAPSSD